MKNKFFTLLKADLKALTLGRVKGKDGQKRGWILPLVGFFVLYIMFALVMQFVLIFDVANQIGMPEVGFLLGGISGFSLIFILSMSEAQDKLFRAKDLPTLATLPLKQSTIFMSKSIAIILTAYMYFSVVFIPLLIAYFWVVGFSIVSLIFALIILLVFPLFPSSIGIAVGRFIAGLSKSSKHRGIVSAIFYGVVLLIFMTVLVGFQIFMAEIYSNPVLANIINIVTYPFGLIGKAIVGDFISLIIFVAIVIAFAIGIMFLASFNYLKLMRVYGQETIKEKKRELEKRSQFVTFLKKEVKKYFSSGIYVFNTIFGVFLAIIATVALLFFDIPPEYGLSDNMMPMIYGAITLMSCTTAVSISLEGKHFHSLKSMPINRKVWLNSKMALNLILISPAMMLCAGVFFIFKGDSVVISLLTILMIPVFNFFSAEFGLFANILFPKFEFQDDTAVVKRSVSTMFGMLVPPVLYITLETVFSFVPIAYGFIMAIEIVALAAGAVALYITNRSFGIKRLAKL